MSSKQSLETIDSQTVESFTRLLSENQETILNSKQVSKSVKLLIDVLGKIEARMWESRSEIASKEISEMTEEDRRLLLMGDKEKRFFLEYKEKNPNSKWNYYKEYQKLQQKEYESNSR